MLKYRKIIYSIMLIFLCVQVMLIFFASVSKLAKIKATTGNIRVENTSAGALDLSATTGKVTVSGVTCRDDITVNVVTGNAYLTDSSCRSVISRGITGSISLNNVIQEILK